MYGCVCQPVLNEYDDDDDDDDYGMLKLSEFAFDLCAGR